MVCGVYARTDVHHVRVYYGMGALHLGVQLAAILCAV
jgi:hypothetical protein